MSILRWFFKRRRAPANRPKAQQTLVSKDYERCAGFKRCAICGEALSAGVIVCGNCGSGRFDSPKTPKETRILTISSSFVSKVPDSRHMKYFEVPIPKYPKFLCSDDSCPCPGTEQLVPGKTGFLYISEDLIKVRSDALTYEKFMEKTERMRKRLGADQVILAGVEIPIFLCEEGALRRALDLRVAAADAEYLFRTGWCPLRPTPKQRGR